MASSDSHGEQSIPGYPTVNYAEMQHNLLREADQILHDKEEREHAAQLASRPKEAMSSNPEESSSERVGQPTDFEPQERGRRDRQVPNKESSPQEAE